MITCWRIAYSFFSQTRLMNNAQQYQRDGYLSPITVVSAADASVHRATLESIEHTHGSLHYLYKLHTFMQSPLQLATAPALLDVVEQLIGPDILLYNTTFVIKEPNSESHVSWHQDLTYWGLSSDAQVSAWIALSPATQLSGCMHMIPGSHHHGQRQHITTTDSNNVLLNGQTVPGVDSSNAKALELLPGQASLHHGWTLHTSMPNRSDDRRIGLNIQYIATDVKQLKSDRDTALLVRGEDRYHHFDADIPANSEFDAVQMEKQKALDALLKGITIVQGNA
ncbi:MAG: phytanoyl-CoA dioxygenase family protein [Pseudomonadota bacterium]